MLARDPSHRLALNNLGTLLHATGYRTAARTAYAEAVARHPGDPMSHVNLGNVLYESRRVSTPPASIMKPLSAPTPAMRRRTRASRMCWPNSATKRALNAHRRKGFEDRPAGCTCRIAEQGPPVSLLLLVSSLGGNIPTRNLLDDRVFQTFVVVPEFYDPQSAPAAA